SFIETLPRRGYRFIAAVRNAESKPATPTGLAATRFVGRQSELATLRKCFNRALQRESQLVFVTGEPGIGKTPGRGICPRSQRDRTFPAHCPRPHGRRQSGVGIVLPSAGCGGPVVPRAGWHCNG